MAKKKANKSEISKDETASAEDAIRRFLRNNNETPGIKAYEALMLMFDENLLEIDPGEYISNFDEADYLERFEIHLQNAKQDGAPEEAIKELQVQLGDAQEYISARAAVHHSFYHDLALAKAKKESVLAILKEEDNLSSNMVSKESIKHWIEKNKNRHPILSSKLIKPGEGETEISPRKETSLYVTMAFLVEAFAQTNKSRYTHTDGTPKVSVIAQKLEQFIIERCQGDLPGYKEEAIKDRIEEALAKKEQLLSDR